MLQVSPGSNLGSGSTLQAPDTAATAARTMSFAQSALLLPHTAVSGTFSVVPSPSMLIPATTLTANFRIIFYLFYYIFFTLYFIYFILYINACEQTTTENMIEKILAYQ